MLAPGPAPPAPQRPGRGGRPQARERASRPQCRSALRRPPKCTSSFLGSCATTSFCCCYNYQIFGSCRAEIGEFWPDFHEICKIRCKFYESLEIFKDFPQFRQNSVKMAAKNDWINDFSKILQKSWKFDEFLQNLQKSENFECGAVRRCMNLVELEKCWKMRIWTQKSALIQQRTSCLKFAELVVGTCT